MSFETSSKNAKKRGKKKTNKLIGYYGLDFKDILVIFLCEVKFSTHYLLHVSLCT